MAKFVMACPECGKYVEAKTGFFAKKKITCFHCGNVINVRTDKLTSRQCPHCGNEVVYDQSLGDKASCPVCHEPINTQADREQLVEFNCFQCGIRLRVNKNAAPEKYVCPVCDYENDVQERLTKEKIRSSGKPSVIKYEGDNDAIIWKHPLEDLNWGSQLIVHETQEAIFLRDGQAMGPYGAGRYTLETQLLPMMEKLYNLPTENKETFHSEVYFINMVTQMAVKWGTPDKVRFIDPLTGVPLELGASGEMNLQVSDSRRLLLKLVGTLKGISLEGGPGQAKSLQNSFRPLVTSTVKAHLSAVIKEEAIDILEIDEKLELISERLRTRLIPVFEEYGLTIPQFFVTNVVLPENDPNFKRIRELHTITLQTRTIQADTIVKTAEQQSKAAIEAARREAVLQAETTKTEQARHEAERTVIAAQAAAQAKRMDGLTEAEIMAAKGYSQKDVLQTEVQKAYAESIGKMGSNVTAAGGTGGGGGNGFLGDMLGLGIGLAAAQTVAPQIGNMFQSMRTGTEPAAPAAPAAPAPAPAGWTCPECGQTNITSKFCPDCGAKKPEPRSVAGWTCPECGRTGITSKFCPDCGAKKPEPKPAPAGWTCPDCGTKDIQSKFCPNCGRKKDE